MVFGVSGRSVLELLSYSALLAFERSKWIYAVWWLFSACRHALWYTGGLVTSNVRDILQTLLPCAHSRNELFKGSQDTHGPGTNATICKLFRHFTHRTDLGNDQVK